MSLNKYCFMINVFLCSIHPPPTSGPVQEIKNLLIKQEQLKTYYYICFIAPQQIFMLHQAFFFKQYTLVTLK